MKRSRVAAALLGLGLLASCATSDARPFARDLDGARLDPLAVPAGRVHVLVWVSHECPIANSYAPTLRALAAAWRTQPVDLFVLHVDPDLTPAAARDHAAAYELPGTVAFDERQAIARSLGVTTTPEAVVLTAAGVAYRGRIDDQWRALGVRAPAATTHDLGAAVARAERGEPTPPPHPAAVGCLLPEPR